MNPSPAGEKFCYATANLDLSHPSIQRLAQVIYLANSGLCLRTHLNSPILLVVSDLLSEVKPTQVKPNPNCNYHFWVKLGPACGFSDFHFSPNFISSPASVPGSARTGKVSSGMSTEC